MTFNQWWDEKGLRIAREQSDEYILAEAAWDAAIDHAQAVCESKYNSLEDDAWDNAVKECANAVEFLGV